MLATDYTVSEDKGMWGVVEFRCINVPYLIRPMTDPGLKDGLVWVVRDATFEEARALLTILRSNT